jgi:hypothetical protein
MGFGEISHRVTEEEEEREIIAHETHEKARKIEGRGKKRRAFLCALIACAWECTPNFRTVSRNFKQQCQSSRLTLI